jgi:hypothetical protein
MSRQHAPAEQQRRERLRLEAAGRSARGDTINKDRARCPGCSGGDGGRVSIPRWRAAGPAAGRRRMAEAKGFTWQDYRDLIIATITTCQPRSLVLR